MKLTTRGRYAVTAMLDLALHRGTGPVALADIARRNRISLAYLEQLFGGLRRQGLVESTRGPGGGYRLARPAAEISVACVIAAVNETVNTTRCGGARNCHEGEHCLTHDLWQDLTRHIHDFLEAVSLAELCARTAKHKPMAGMIPLRRMTSSGTVSLAAK